jgi:hypothetical protein
MTTPNRELADWIATIRASGEIRALDGPPALGTSSRQIGLVAAAPLGSGVAPALGTSAPVSARLPSLPATMAETTASVTAANAKGPRFTCSDYDARRIQHRR